MLIKRYGTQEPYCSGLGANQFDPKSRTVGGKRRLRSCSPRLPVFFGAGVLFFLALTALQPWRHRRALLVARVAADGAAASDLASISRQLAPSTGGGHGLDQRHSKEIFPPDTTSSTQPDPAHRWLSFSVCNGLSNQRLAILGAVLLAQESGRALLLPRLLPNGMQSSEEQVTEDSAPSCGFQDIMDPELFTSEMKVTDVQVVKRHPQIPPPSAHLDLTLGNTLGQLAEAHMEPHVRLSCPLLRVPPRLYSRHQQLTWRALAALQPSPHLARVAADVEALVLRDAGSEAFNVLHLRLESDWEQHCSQEGFVFREECMRHTDAVGERLRQLGITTELPLLLVLDRKNVGQERYKVALDSLESAGYSPLLMPDPPGVTLSREQAAMVSYRLAMRSHQFVGNAVSTFTALIIMERRHASKFAAHYNGGDIPLQYFVPLLQDSPLSRV